MTRKNKSSGGKNWYQKSKNVFRKNKISTNKTLRQ